MAMIITNDCINCGACASECPADAIYEPREDIKVSENDFSSNSNEHFFIVTNICTNCSGFAEIKCIAICPMNSIKDLIID
jgi:ferredoxin